ncbi:MAG: hypothetical protein ACPGRX_00660 [Bdellovibrionales bacterium]
MSLEYVERKIVEALKAVKGNQARARQQIIAWAMQDPELLKGLTRAHLSGIVAYNVERVMSGRAAAARAAKKQTAPANAQAPQKPKPKTKEDAFGMELLKAVASSSSEVFGLENGSSGIGRPGQVSQNHINVIRAMAAKGKKS